MKKIKSFSLSSLKNKAVVAGALVLILGLLFYVVNIALKPNSPTISDVLSKSEVAKSESGVHPNAFLFGGAALGLLAITLRSYQDFKKHGKARKNTQLAFASYEGELGRLREEIKEGNFLREQISREASKSKEETRYLEEEVLRLKNELQKRFEAEELLKKSNEALRRGYDKLAMEKERLSLSSQKAHEPLMTQNQLFSGTPVVRRNVVEPMEREKQREAVEKLIEEVDQILANKKPEKKIVKPVKNKLSGKRSDKK